MDTPPGSGAGPGVAERMGLKPSMLVMEIGYDDDVDLGLRGGIEAYTGERLLDEGTDEVVDCVLVWFRDEDGDLVDLLVDAVGPLTDDGTIWLLTPKRGRGGYVEPSDISDAAAVAGLSQTSITTVSGEWSGVRLVGRKSSGGRR